MARVMGTRWRRRTLGTATLFVLIASSAWWYRWASGPHRVAAVAGTTASAPSEYLYTDADPSHIVSYVRPVVASYARSVARGAKVLDLGCGNGWLLASFEDRGWERIGLDVSASGLQEARQHHPDITFLRADVTGDLTEVLDMGTFDLVISTEVIEHVMLPRAMIGNAFRALRPGGRLVLSTPYHGYLKNLAIAVLGQTDGHLNPLWDYGHVKFFSVDTLGTLLTEAGFVDLEYTGAGRFPYLWKSMVFSARKPS